MSDTPGPARRGPVLPQPDPATTGLAGEVRDDRYVGEQDLTAWPSRAGHAIATAGLRLAKWIGPYSALILTLLAGSVIIASLTKLFGEIYEAVRQDDDVAVLDRPVLDFALSIRTPFWDRAITVFTDIAGTVGMPIIAVTAIVVLALTRRSWTPVILIVAAGGGSLLMTIVGKDLIGRARPPLADAVPPYEYSPSFPSGHSLNALVVVGIIAYLLVLRQHSKRARATTITIAVLFAGFVGLSRVYLGHHWLTDVLAAWTLGVAWLALVITAHRLYLTARHREAAGHPGAADAAAPASR